jgi:hypothetical protein
MGMICWTDRIYPAASETRADGCALGGWPIHKFELMLWVPHSCSLIA